MSRFKLFMHMRMASRSEMLCGQCKLRLRHLLVVVVPISKWNEKNPMRREREGEVPVD